MNYPKRVNDGQAQSHMSMFTLETKLVIKIHYKVIQIAFISMHFLQNRNHCPLTEFLCAVYKKKSAMAHMAHAGLEVCPRI